MKPTASDYGVEAVIRRRDGEFLKAAELFHVAAQKSTHQSTRDQYLKSEKRCRRKAAGRM